MERDGEKIDAWNKYNASTRFDNASCVVVGRNFKASRRTENLFSSWPVFSVVFLGEFK